METTFVTAVSEQNDLYFRSSCDWFWWRWTAGSSGDTWGKCSSTHFFVSSHSGENVFLTGQILLNRKWVKSFTLDFIINVISDVLPKFPEKWKCSICKWDNCIKEYRDMNMNVDSIDQIIWSRKNVTMELFELILKSNYPGIVSQWRKSQLSLLLILLLSRRDNWDI